MEAEACELGDNGVPKLFAALPEPFTRCERIRALNRVAIKSARCTDALVTLEYLAAYHFGNAEDHACTCPRSFGASV